MLLPFATRRHKAAPRGVRHSPGDPAATTVSQQRQLHRPIRPLDKTHFPLARAKPDPSRASAAHRATQAPQHFGERLTATLPDHQPDRIEDRAFAASELEPAIRPVAQPMIETEGRRVHAAAYRENRKGTTVQSNANPGGSHQKNRRAHGWGRACRRRVATVVARGATERPQHTINRLARGSAPNKKRLPFRTGHTAHPQRQTGAPFRQRRACQAHGRNGLGPMARPSIRSFNQLSRLRFRSNEKTALELRVAEWRGYANSTFCASCALVTKKAAPSGAAPLF
jgi:hypothetical protein